MIKRVLKQFVPPVITKTFRFKSRYGWNGNYSSWLDAQEMCTGYDAANILEKCKSALLKVKNGESVYERDSALFSEIQYSWPLVAGLMACAVENGGFLNVLDFGGSLGSSYFQNRSFLRFCRECTWSIVEQKQFVDCGMELFEDDVLKFYHSIEDCRVDRKPDVILLSSVIQYLEKPQEWLKKIVLEKFKYIIIDRTPFIHRPDDIITVQTVPPEFYSASYPCWAFNEKKFLNELLSDYDVISDFDALDESNIDDMYFKGFLLRSRIKV